VELEGIKEHGFWKGCVVGRGRSELMTETVPFLWNLLPFVTTVCLSGQEQALSSSLLNKGGTRFSSEANFYGKKHASEMRLDLELYVKLQLTKGHNIIFQLSVCFSCRLSQRWPPK